MLTMSYATYFQSWGEKGRKLTGSVETFMQAYKVGSIYPSLQISSFLRLRD